MGQSVIFFDIGGTLVDSPDIFEVITRKLTNRWPDKKTYDLVLKAYEGIISSTRNDKIPFKSIANLHATALSNLARQYGFRDMSNEAREITIDVYGHRSKFFPETQRVLEQLLTYGVKMIVASDNDCDILAVQKKKHNLGKYFVDFCISENARAYKPSHVFLDTLKKYLPDHPSDCYFVGDMPFDVECADRMGIKPALVVRNSSNTKDIDYVIPDLIALIPLMGLR